MSCAVSSPAWTSPVASRHLVPVANRAECLGDEPLVPDVLGGRELAVAVRGTTLRGRHDPLVGRRRASGW